MHSSIKIKSNHFSQMLYSRKLKTMIRCCDNIYIIISSVSSSNSSKGVSSKCDRGSLMLPKNNKIDRHYKNEKNKENKNRKV